MSRSHLVIWEARHENGWVTTLAQQPDGSYVASAEQPGRFRVACLGVTLEQARSAVIAALQRTTGHSVCTSLCSEWAMRVGGSPQSS